MEPEQTAESVWDYPRPPRLEATSSLVRIVHGGVVLAETRRALRVLETSHPPVFYLPPADVRMDFMRPAKRPGSFCEFKGVATYWSLDVTAELVTATAGAFVPDVAWSYAHPTAAYAALRDHLAFYASRVDLCTVDGERVRPQEGDFYGGWITGKVRGPFKGPPGTRGW